MTRSTASFALLQTYWFLACTGADAGMPLAADTGGSPAFPAALATVTVRTPAPRAALPPAGVDLVDEAAARGLTDQLPAYGRGTTLLDVDNDGWIDIWQSHAALEGQAQRLSKLWRNQGDGTFAPLPMPFAEFLLQGNWSGTWADFDNDGDQDLVTVSGGYNGPGRLAYWRNDLSTGGGFVEATQAAGIRRTVARWWSASEQDFDRDGDLDLVVTGTMDGVLAPCCEHAWDTSKNLVQTASPLHLYVNQGDGTFVESAEAFGLTGGLGDGKNPTWWDHDSDGWPDLFVANMLDYNEQRPDWDGTAAAPKLYRNLAGKGFADVTEQVLPEPALRGPVFAAVTADVDQDGREDLVLGRNVYQDEVFYARGDGAIEVHGRDHGLDTKNGWESPENSMGFGVGDLDGNGYPEVFVGPGWPSFTGQGVVHSSDAAGFRRLSLQGNRAGWYHGVATGDVDNDGDDDVFWNLGGFAPVDDAAWFWAKFLQPDAPTEPLDSRQQPLMLVNHAAVGQTVSITLVGTQSNRDAVGAKLVVLGERPSFHSVPFTQGFGSRDSRRMNLSLGARTQARVEVRWPSGTVTRNLVTTGTHLVLTEP